MNKVFIGMVLAVCVLGMALLMLNERLARKADQPEQTAQTAPQVMPDIGAPLSPPAKDANKEAVQTATPGQIAAAVESLENKEAIAALAPPLIKPEDVKPVRKPAAVEQPAAAESPELRQEILEAAEVQLQNEAKQEVKPAETVPEVKPVETVPEVKQEVAAPEPAQVAPPVAAPVPAQEVEKPKPAPPAKQETPKPAKAAPAQNDRSIQRFVVFARDKGATVRITGSGKMNYKSMTLENPNRVVVDLDGDWKFPDRFPVPKNELVNSVRIGKIDNKTRVVIDLKEKPRTSRIIPAKAGDGFDVRVDK